MEEHEINDEWINDLEDRYNQQYCANEDMTHSVKQKIVVDLILE